MTPALKDALHQLAEAQRQVKNAELATQQLAGRGTDEQMQKLITIEYSAEDRRDRALQAVLLAFGEANDRRQDRTLMETALSHLEGYEKLLTSRADICAPMLPAVIARVKQELGR